jgi:thiamine pyrophosphate-dependent acetolactate synthase large subunit-like protein
MNMSKTMADQRSSKAQKPATVREAFFAVARRLNLTTIFGNPGSTELTFLQDFPDDFRYVLALQEACAAGMRPPVRRSATASWRIRELHAVCSPTSCRKRRDRCRRRSGAHRSPPVGAKITVELLYHTINELRPANSVLVHESESSVLALKERLPTSSPRAFFTFFSGVRGYGLSASAGVALAEKDLKTQRKVINIVGDGAAQYVIQSIWTAVQHQLPILYVIPRNQEYAVLKAFAEQLKASGVPGLDLPGIDCVSIAKGYGCEGRRIARPEDLEPALREGLAMKTPYLLEVEIERGFPALP